MTLNEKENIKRLAIYFFYDTDGIVDRYVPCILEEVKKHCSEIFIVCNGKLNDQGHRTLEAITPNVLVRENKGFDVWAYKTALDHYGWETLETYDEVIMMNSTVFGPLYPFSEMFEEMNKRDVDFWGITKHHKVNFDAFGTCKYKYIPEHIQSNFLVIRQSMMKSPEYHALWDKMRPIKSYGESVGYYEAIFTKDFEEKGFVSDVYIDTSKFDGYTRYPLMMMAPQLIKNQRCPVLKVKSFSQDYNDILEETIGTATIDVFDFIRDHLTYDVDMIWEHVLRVSNMADVKKLMHLNYILPQDHMTSESMIQGKKIALMMHLYYPDLVDYCLRYAMSMPQGSDLFVTVPNEKMKKEILEKTKDLDHFNKVTVILIGNRGRDVSALLVGCAPYVNDYDYVCFVHDKKTTQLKPYCVGEDFGARCFENNLATPEFVENILSTFEKNPRLGLLTPPPPNHASFYQIVGSEWASNYENTLALATKLNLNTNIYWTKEPIAPLGTMFWFRPKAMKPLFDQNWKYEDFPQEPNGYDGTLLHAIERIYAFVVQDQGYYPAWVLTDRLARVEITNLNFMLREINTALFGKYYTTNLRDMVGRIEENMYLDWNRKTFKQKMKRITPKPIWKLMKKIYYFFNRSKRP